MWVDIVQDVEYKGPNIVQLALVMDEITVEIIKLHWTNTNEEFRLLEQYPNRKFTLYVDTPQAEFKAIALFGKRLKIPYGVVERGKLLLVDSETYDWRNFVEQTPSVNIRYLLLQLCANAIRNGKQPSLVGILSSVFVNSISISDVDVLLRLKSNCLRG